MIALPIAEQRKQHEWKIVVSIAKNNDFLLIMIHSLSDKMVYKTKKLTTGKQTQRKKKLSPLHIISFLHVRLLIY
jgi:hypothetical protein